MTDVLKQQTIKLSNHLPAPRMIVLEPWGGEYPLLAGESVDLRVEGGDNHPLAIELFEDRVVISSLDTGHRKLTLTREGRQLNPQ